MEQRKPLPKSPYLTAGILLAAGLSFTGFALALSGTENINWGGDTGLFFLNFLPVVFLLFFLWLLTGFSWLSAMIIGILVFLLAGGTYFKLMFRNSPVFWEDIYNLNEGVGMARQYEVTFPPLLWCFFGVIFAFTIALLFFGRGRPSIQPRFLLLTFFGVGTLIVLNWICGDEERYAACAGDYSFVLEDAYNATGITYPFFHSRAVYRADVGNCNPAEAGKILSGYRDGSIPEERKVNLITLQLEAFVDLSVYDIDGLDPSVYRDFHKVLDRSYSGTLVTDIFAGGTTETEWAVLTGGNKHGSFTEPTNSVAWYLKSQGYTANGSHPSRAWFYNRVEINPNLGLDDYLFVDNYYKKYTDDDVCYDDIFFPDLKKRLTSWFKEKDNPLFSFNVTYQGHGPYNEKKAYWGTKYCTGDYPKPMSNALNNYFHVVQDTSGYVLDFLDYLDTRKEPIVLLLYGDHKPWMGNNGCYYDALGINMNPTTEEGFLNYYATWYAIYANPAAKERLGWDVTGEGPMLSPCFLMDEVFQICGWEGSAYMQAQHEVKTALPVLHKSGWCMEKGVFTNTPNEESIALKQQFQSVSRYDRTHFNGSGQETSSKIS